MLKKLCFSIALIVIIISTRYINAEAKVGSWNDHYKFEVTSKQLSVYSEPDIKSQKLFILYKGMTIESHGVIIADGYKWLKISNKNFWIPAMQPGGITNIMIKTNSDKTEIKDFYGIMDMPHNYAVKLVKYHGAKGKIETYKKINNKYIMQNTYKVRYPKEGPKSLYGDYKTVGGNTIRYIYRTTRSGMNGRNAKGENFGVYKISYPMPHDGLSGVLNGNLSVWQYNKLPAINKYSNGEYCPHPGSKLGADIVLHTAKRGSRGCIIVDNEEMSYMYHNDLVSDLNTEIIPLVIYDEDIIAPPTGRLF